jgi:protein tyrosine phosphatase (PTP) superfamily phosphohydrolase (DUF442 family)
MDESSWRRRWPRRALPAVGTGLGLLLVLVLVARTCGFLGDNLRAVVPGRVYRSAQLSPGRLEGLIRDRGLRTVITLREGDASDPWFRAEAAVCARLGVDYQVIPLRASALPPPRELQRLLETFDRAKTPLLFHCKGGADRSGLVGAIYLNLYRGLPLDQAERQQLSWRSGHIPARAPAMERFFAIYRQSAEGCDLRDWIENRYPGIYQQTHRRRGARGQVPSPRTEPPPVPRG